MLTGVPPVAGVASHCPHVSGAVHIVLSAFEVSELVHAAAVEHFFTLFGFAVSSSSVALHRVLSVGGTTGVS